MLDLIGNKLKLSRNKNIPKVEENKKEFISFLKKCQVNYLKMIETEKDKVRSLENLFSILGNETEVKTA